jgi:hypothetical protein
VVGASVPAEVVDMYSKIQVVFDAADPAALAEFWALALGYVPEPPPEGFTSWADFGRSIGLPEERFGDQTAIRDPAGAGPRLYFQRVPEGKTAKNRVHLDVRTEDVEAHVRRLVAAGASIAWRVDELTGKAVVLRDPEGNEFCVT